jgi:hypothetical protein
MSVLLWPNFGAEEGRPLRVPPDERLVPLARAWASVFAGDVTIEGVLSPLPGFDAPAYDELAGASGLVPWLSTDQTVAAAQERGLDHFGPAPAVARALGDKAWSLSCARALDLEPRPLREVAHAFDPEELTAAAVESRLSSWPAALRESWTLKPRHGSSGRGRVKGRGPHLDDAGRRSLPKLCARGGAVLEPWLSRTADLSAQLWVPAAGPPRVLATTRMRNSASGLWEGNEGLVDADGVVRSGHARDEELRIAAAAVATRAQEAGFHGPLGLDAFCFALDGEEHLRALVEVNARFSTGLVAVALVRRALAAERSSDARRWRLSADGLRPQLEPLSA